MIAANSCTELGHEWGDMSATFKIGSYSEAHHCKAADWKGCLNMEKK